MIHTKLNVCYIHVIWKRIYHIYVFGGGGVSINTLVEGGEVV